MKVDERACESRQQITRTTRAPRHLVAKKALTGIEWETIAAVPGAACLQTVSKSRHRTQQNICCGSRLGNLPVIGSASKNAPLFLGNTFHRRLWLAFPTAILTNLSSTHTARRVRSRLDCTRVDEGDSQALSSP